MRKIPPCRPRYRANRDLSGIDKNILPLVKVLNRWKKRPGGYYTGIATTFSCAGHSPEDDAYVAFHSSRKQAEALADCIRGFNKGKGWVINFRTNFYDLRSTGGNTALGESAAALAEFLRTHPFFVENDPGWRMYLIPDLPLLYSIIDQNTIPSFEDYTTDFLEYLASHEGSMKRRTVMRLMYSRFAGRKTVIRALERLKKCDLVSEESGSISLRRELKPTMEVYRERLLKKSLKGPGIVVVKSLNIEGLRSDVT